MLRELRHKYVYYLGAPHQLFDLEGRPRGVDRSWCRPGARPAAHCAVSQPGGYIGLGDQDGLSLAVRIDAPIGAEKPIPEIVDYRKIAIGIPVVEKMELLLSPEPGKSSQP